MSTPILQFGTSRFLQAHVDLFVDEALEHGDALGRITVVQTTGSVQSARRLAAFNTPGGYPVRIRGRQEGVVVERERQITAIAGALNAGDDWLAVRELAATVEVIVSNTGDRGYEMFAEDSQQLLAGATPPRGFPAKLLVLLYERFRRGGAAITLYPCELVSNNGSVLHDLVLNLARQWGLGDAFLWYLATGCIWVNSLVDRIVSEPIEPAGAVAEPYAIWVVEKQEGMTLPCVHPCLVITENLEPFERRKLFLLNLGHTFLAECWLADVRAPDETVAQAMADLTLRAELEALWEEEVLPLFRALGEGNESRAYLAEVRDRFCNPFLAHKLADIAQNHAEKKRRRLLPVLTMADDMGLGLAQPRLRAALRQVAT